MQLSTLTAPWLVLTRPADTLAQLKNKKRWAWIPFLLIMFSQSLLWLCYYHHIDLEWLIAKNTSQGNGDVEQMEQMASVLSANVMTLTTVAGVIISVVVAYSISAFYLQQMTKHQPASNDTVEESPADPTSDPLPVSGFDVDPAQSSGIGFGRWFGFICWVSLPTVIASLFLMVLIMTSNDPRLPIENLAMFSLNQLVFHLPVDATWFSILQSITLIQWWSLFLAIVGVHRWSSLTLGGAATVCLLPYLFIYGVWAAIIALF